MAILRGEGIGDDAVALVARSDIELEAIPDRHKQADTDFIPAAIRGAGVGGATGLLAGLAATVIAPLGITLAGAAMVAAVGAAVGTWASALMGSSLPDPVRQQFEDEIAAGRILLVLDLAPAEHARLRPLLETSGAQALDYAAPAAMS
ncbi:hypothetical protein GLE_2479 [Lysobacter enzymogenes]|uniref:Uncharacterized protein n=1 Tax=Lysobacter enzymogenes TaxID=69 RepID=A0A0S2DHA2_LYSEN|nr:hypothetical protein [Lysobacter enzymogenes]ALN57828.1 hypothetical protein GLE_2479 [Lysobacter enzymogenes]QCW26340.1 hypothetical protein FE772_12385 [Lysobacter enzymogenes]